MKSTKKNMKCTCPTRKFRVGTQRNLYSTGLRLGFASGKKQLLGFALGENAKNWRHLTQKIPTCWYPQRKSLASGLLPNANPRRQNFASQWNIGFNTLPHTSVSLTRCISNVFFSFEYFDPYDHYAACWVTLTPHASGYMKRPRFRLP